MPNPIFTWDHSYSPVFSKAGQKAFRVEDYNNSTGKYELFTLVWKNGEFKIDNTKVSVSPTIP